MKTYTLTRIHDPFNRTDKDVATYEYRGEPLSVLRERHLPAGVEFVFSVGGRVIPEGQLSEVIPQPGEFVTCLPVLGDGGNGKQIGTLIAMIAISALAIWAAPALVGTLAIQMSSVIGQAAAGWMVGAGMGIMSGMVAGGLMVAGGMLVNAVSPAARPTIPSIGMDYGKSQLYGWNPQTIQQQGGAIPEWFGRNKLYGNIIGSYIDTDGDQQYLNVLISLGYGPYNDIPAATMQINDQPISNFSGVTPEVRLGHLDQEVISRFYATKTDYPLSRKITTVAPVVYTTETGNFDTLEIEVACPQGLYSVNNNGGYDAVTVQARVEISLHGADQWRNISVTAENYYATNLTRWSAGYWVKSVTKPVAGAPLPSSSKLWYEIQAGENVYLGYHEFPADPAGGGLPYWAWTPNHNVGETLAGHPEAQWRWFDGSTEINLVQSTVDYFDLTGNAAKPLRRTFKASNLVHGQYDVRITRLSADSPDSNVRLQSGLYLSKVSTATPDAQEYPREALVALRALSTDQLSGSLRFSVIADCKLIRVYEDSAWSVRYSNNPAWVMWHIFTRPVFDNNLAVIRYDGYDPTKLDLTKFVELANRCNLPVPDGNGGTEPLFQFDGGFDSEGNVWSAAMQVGEECGAVPFWNGFRITLAIDQPAVPEAGFGMGSIVEGSFEETWLPIADRATEVEISFRNQVEDYKQTPYTVMDPDTPAISPNKTQRQAVGITRSSAAWRYGLRKIKCNQVLLCGIKFTVDIESIACTLGDCFNFSNDWPQWGFSGRAVAATVNTITLDRQVTIDAGKTYQVMIIHSDGSSSTRSVTDAPGTYETLTVATPFTLLPELYDQYFFGETELIAKPFIITKLEPTGELQATIYALEYNDTLENVYSGAPVLPTPNYALINSLPSVTDLNAVERIVDLPDNSQRDEIMVSWKNPLNSAFKGVEIWINTGGGYVYAATKEDEEYNFTVDKPGNISIAIRSINLAGERQQLANAELFSITAVGFIAEIPVPSGLQIFGQANNPEFVGRDLKLTWNKPAGRSASVANGSAGTASSDAWFKWFEVVIKDAGGTIRRTEQLITPQYIYDYEKNYSDGQEIPSRNLIIEIRSVSKLNGKSDPARLTVSNPAPPVVALTLSAEFKGFSANLQPSSVPDIGGYVIHASQAAGFAPAENTLVNRGPETYFRYAVPSTGTWYIKAGAYDTFGEDLINYSPQYAVTIPDAQILPDDLYTTLRADFLILDSIFYFGDNGADPTPATETTLYWSVGKVARAANVYTLAAGNLANAVGKFVIATLTAGSAVLSLTDINAGIPALNNNQIIIAYTSGTPNSAGNYICYVRQANSVQFEGANIRDLTVLSALIKDITIDNATTETLYSNLITVLNLVVGDNVTMGPDATISWSKVSSPPAIPTDTTDLTDGANLGGTADWSGVSGRPNTTYIDENGVYTGTLSADKIVSGTEIKIDSTVDAVLSALVVGVDSISKTPATIYNTSRSSTQAALTIIQGQKLGSPLSSGPALVATSRGNYGAVLNGGLAPLLLTPIEDASPPTHSAAKGAIFLTSECVMYVNKSQPSPGTTWEKIGSQ